MASSKISFFFDRNTFSAGSFYVKTIKKVTRVFRFCSEFTYEFLQIFSLKKIIVILALTLHDEGEGELTIFERWRFFVKLFNFDGSYFETGYSWDESVYAVLLVIQRRFKIDVQNWENSKLNFCNEGSTFHINLRGCKIPFKNLKKLSWICLFMFVWTN